MIIGLKLHHYLQTDMKYKTCPKCKVEKSFNDYYRRQDAGHKQQTYCISCMKEYNKKKHQKLKKLKGNAWWL